MQFRLLSSVAAATALLLTACGGADFKKTKSGVPYQVFEGEGDAKIAQGSFVKFHVVQRIGDSTISNTYNTFPEYMRVEPGGTSYDIRSNLLEVLPQVRVGDSIHFVQSLDTFIKKDPQLLQKTPFKKGDQVITGVRVLAVYSDEAAVQADYEKENWALFDRSPQVKQQMATDDQKIRAYLDSANIDARKIGRGTYIQILEPGTGAKAKDGQFVSVLYRGTLFSGKEFDTNMKPGGQPFVINLGKGGSIKGFEEGIRELAEGGKARIFVPSMLAYGAQQMSEDIGPFSSLIFDLQIADISDTAPAPPAGTPGALPDSSAGGR